MRTHFSLFLYVFISPLFFYLSSCSWDQTYLIGSDGDGVKDSVCFQNEILPIINSNCAISGCHDAATQTEGYNFSTYEGIMTAVKPGKPEDSKLYEVITATDDDIMPPAPNTPLTTEQISLIEKWILEGAGYNVDCNTGTPCDTANVTYSGTVSIIISNNCLGCHSSENTGGGILLKTWSQVHDQTINGNLICAINWKSSCSPMPKNASKLSSCDLLKIQIWADEDAPNN